MEGGIHEDKSLGSTKVVMWPSKYVCVCVFKMHSLKLKIISHTVKKYPVYGEKDIKVISQSSNKIRVIMDLWLGRCHLIVFLVSSVILIQIFSLCMWQYHINVKILYVVLLARDCLATRKEWMKIFLIVWVLRQFEHFYFILYFILFYSFNQTILSQKGSYWIMYWKDQGWRGLTSIQFLSISSLYVSLSGKWDGKGVIAIPNSGKRKIFPKFP